MNRAVLLLVDMAFRWEDDGDVVQMQRRRRLQPLQSLVPSSHRQQQHLHGLIDMLSRV